MIADYRQMIDELLPSLRRDNLALAVEIARVPEDIRGYGHVKARHLEPALAKACKLMEQLAR